MRHIHKILFVLPALILSLSLVSGCGSSEPTVVPPAADGGPQIDPAKAQKDLEDSKNYDPKADNKPPTGNSSPPNL